MRKKKVSAESYSGKDEDGLDGEVGVAVDVADGDDAHGLPVVDGRLVGHGVGRVGRVDGEARGGLELEHKEMTFRT